MERSVYVVRVIAELGDAVAMNADENAYVNNRLLKEPYVKQKTFGEQYFSFPLTSFEWDRNIFNDLRPLLQFS